MTLAETLDRLPAPMARHLAFLWAGKAALRIAEKPEQGDSQYGANDAAIAVLSLVCAKPTELHTVTLPDGRTQDRVRLHRSLFRPLKSVRGATPWQFRVYRSALDTAEIQLRLLHDA